MYNWKTTLAGVAAILTGIGDLLNIIIGVGDTSHVSVDVSSILAGVGLLFAKDSNVTGGTTRQPS